MHCVPFRSRKGGSDPLITSRVYVYLGQERLGFLDNNSLFYTHNSPLGAPQKVTNPNRQVVWQARYEPFGQTTLINPAIPLNPRLPGQYFDQETGLHYNYYRDYDPTLGRYMQPDPIGLEGGVNRYAYVENNPIRYVDPQGTNPMAGALGGAEVGGTVGGPVGAIVGGLVGATMGGAIIYDMARKRGKSDPVSGLNPVNPGRDYNGKCNPCPPPEVWSAEGDAHGSTGGVHYHGIVWNQDLGSCECFPKRVSGPTQDDLE
jgi:RHS repeat-associated protein